MNKITTTAIPSTIVAPRPRGALGFLNPLFRLDPFFIRNEGTSGSAFPIVFPGQPENASQMATRALWSRELTSRVSQALESEVKETTGRVILSFFSLLFLSMSLIVFVGSGSYAYASANLNICIVTAWVMVYFGSRDSAHSYLDSLHRNMGYHAWNKVMQDALECASKAGLKIDPQLETLLLLTSRKDVSSRIEAVSTEDVAALADLAFAIHVRAGQIVHKGDRIDISGATSELLSRTIETMTGDEQTRSITL